MPREQLSRQDTGMGHVSSHLNNVYAALAETPDIDTSSAKYQDAILDARKDKDGFWKVTEKLSPKDVIALEILRAMMGPRNTEIVPVTWQKKYGDPSLASVERGAWLLREYANPETVKLLNPPRSDEETRSRGFGSSELFSTITGIGKKMVEGVSGTLEERWNAYQTRNGEKRQQQDTVDSSWLGDQKGTIASTIGDRQEVAKKLAMSADQFSTGKKVTIETKNGQPLFSVTEVFAPSPVRGVDIQEEDSWLQKNKKAVLAGAALVGGVASAMAYNTLMAAPVVLDPLLLEINPEIAKGSKTFTKADIDAVNQAFRSGCRDVVLAETMWSLDVMVKHGTTRRLRKMAPDQSAALMSGYIRQAVDEAISANPYRSLQKANGLKAFDGAWTYGLALMYDYAERNPNSQWGVPYAGWVTMPIVHEQFEHGLGPIARAQTEGQGRNPGNIAQRSADLYMRHNRR